MKTIKFSLFLFIFQLTNTLYGNVNPQFQWNFIEEVRDYQFGEKRSIVLQKESQCSELQLIPSLTNNTRLVYQATLFNRPVKIVFSFRDDRLSSIIYFWILTDLGKSFYARLTRLLNKKYGSPQPIQKLITNQGIFNLKTYTKIVSQTNMDGLYIPTPLLNIELEEIQKQNSSNNTYILEFRPYDMDRIIEEKILLEDL